MKKTSLINAPVSEIIASMGHGQKLLICDSGLPLPYDSYKVDLAVSSNVPRFLEVLEAVMTELEVERAVIAEELKSQNDNIYGTTLKVLSNIPIESVSHEEFKNIVFEDPDIFIVRTGEATPYANIILQSGVTF